MLPSIMPIAVLDEDHLMDNSEGKKARGRLRSETTSSDTENEEAPKPKPAQPTKATVRSVERAILTAPIPPQKQEGPHHDNPTTATTNQPVTTNNPEHDGGDSPTIHEVKTDNDLPKAEDITPTSPPKALHKSMDVDNLPSAEEKGLIAARRSVRDRAEARRKAKAEEERAAVERTTATSTVAPQPQTDLIPCPPGGWKEVHGLSGVWFMDNTQERLLDYLDRIPGRKLACVVEGEHPLNKERVNLVVDALMAEADEITQSNGIKATAALAEVPTTRNHELPYGFLLYNLLHEAYDKLLDIKVSRSLRLCFFIYPLTPAPLNYLGTITRIHCVKDDADMSSILTCLWAALAEGPLLGTLMSITYDRCTTIALETSEAMEEVTVDHALKIIHTIRVERLETCEREGKLMPAINMYTNHDFDESEFEGVRDAISRTKLNLYIHGVGRYQAQWNCVNCRSADHPTGLCPYLHVENDVPLSNPRLPHHIDRQGKASVARRERSAPATPDRNRNTSLPPSAGPPRKRGRGAYMGPTGR